MLDVNASTPFTLPPMHQLGVICSFVAKPRAHTIVRLNSFSIQVINDWNNLPGNLVNAHSLSCFKNLSDIHWTDS